MKSKLTPCIQFKKGHSRWIPLFSLITTLLLSSNAVHSQATHKDESNDSIYELEEFEIVGGFSGSLADAAAKKQQASLIVEVISAEDIGKLPDTSIAETLARLPGIATQRINGRAQIISIRGLNEDFSSATLNGREQVSTGSSRAIEYDQYPAELISGAVIYKTGDPSVVTQGIAGVVDLRTVKPLTYSKPIVSYSSTYEWTEEEALIKGNDNGGWRHQLSYIDQFLEGKLGISIGYAYTDKKGQGKQWGCWGYAQYTDPTNDETYDIIGGAKPFIRASKLERHGLIGTLEYKPNQKVTTSIDLYYTQFKEDQNLAGIELPLYAWGFNPFLGYAPSVVGPYTTEGSVMTSGTLDGVRGVIRNDLVTRDADIYSVGWNLDIKDTLGWDLNMDLSYSNINRDDFGLESYSSTSLLGSQPDDTMSFKLSKKGIQFTHEIDYSDKSILVLTDPADWDDNVVPSGQLAYKKNTESEDELFQGKIVASRDLDMFMNLFNRIELGANSTDRSKYEYEKGYYVTSADGKGTVAGHDGTEEVEFPSSVKTSTTDLSFIGIGNVIHYDPIEMLNSGAYKLIRNPNADVLAQDWDASETITTLYAKMGLESNLNEMFLSGNIGFQAIHSDQSSSGSMATGGMGEDTLSKNIQDGDKYWDFLPSINLTLNISENRYLRLSASKQLSRQRMDYMRAGTEFAYNSNYASSTDLTKSPWSGTGGNPKLKPWEADALDLSIEQYFKNNMGYVSLSGFFKDLKSYTYQKNTLTDFTFLKSLYGDINPALWQGYVNRWTNGEGGEIKGLEATLSLPGELISDSLSGFGIILSGSYTKSTVSYEEGVKDSALPGLSDKVASSTLYYEKNGLSARISATYRSDYLATISTFGERGRKFRTVDEETVIDAQVSYTFQDGPLENASIILQMYNITNEPLSSYADGNKLKVIDYQEYGKSFALGISYKF